MSQGKIKDSTLVWICYALYAGALICGGITCIIAVIVNYLTRGNIQDPILRNHIDWQIGTFWRALIGGGVLVVLTFLLAVTWILSFLTFPLWLVFAIWYIYRIAKGALALNSGKTVAGKYNNTF